MSGRPQRSLLVRAALVALVAVALGACSREVPREPVVREPTGSTAASPAVSPVSAPAASAVAPASAAAPARGAARLAFLAPPADADLGAFLRTERLRAKAGGRLLVVYAGASWCPPCKRFHAAAHGGELDADLGATTLVELDADNDRARLEALGYMYKNIPYFAIPGENGRVHEALSVVDTTQGAQRQIVDTLTRWQAAR
ncbi:MAG TPA: hypothetical protein PK141_02940 [Polyangiaceae bacterium]|nr:hypothetical protein [Polyangiaceae bacterium]